MYKDQNGRNSLDEFNVHQLNDQQIVSALNFTCAPLTDPSFYLQVHTNWPVTIIAYANKQRYLPFIQHCQSFVCLDQ